MTDATFDAHDDAAGWQPLPARARTVFVLAALPLALPPAVAALILGAVFRLPGVGWLALAGALLGAGLGRWAALKHWRHTHWRLDAEGFSLRRGRMWQSETRIPANRVQHLDLRRGPLQRRYGLATLVIHTAGTRQSAVSVQGLDEQDAERLRDVLARQRDGDDSDG